MKGAYYNEFDPKAAAWLRELISAGLIAPGDVDTRSIAEVSPYDLNGYTQCHFFAGIGGWSLALRLAGWPDDRPVWTGSCPCQPFSAAGKGLGVADERHLWPRFYDLIAFGQPAAVFGEQVASAAGREWFAGVRADLEGVGYAVGGADLCAAGVGAPHIRQRLYWVAYAGLSRRGALLGSVGTNGRAAQQPDGHGNTGRLAHADGGQSGHGGVQSGGQHGQQPADGGAGGVGHAGSGGGGRDSGAISSAEGEGAGQWCGVGRGADESVDAGAVGGVGHADVPGCKQQCGPEPISAKQSAAELRGNAGNFWSAYDLLPCTDGKARRIEPGSFPLAHGVPGRVGLLRGYGNAINPQLAAEFIAACEEAVRGRA